MPPGVRTSQAISRSASNVPGGAEVVHLARTGARTSHLDDCVACGHVAKGKVPCRPSTWQGDSTAAHTRKCHFGTSTDICEICRGPQRRRRGLRARTARHRTPLPTIPRAEGPASPRLRSQRRKIPLRRGRALATMTRTSPPGQLSVRSATTRRRASRQASGVSGPSWRTSSGPSTAIFLLRQIRSSSIHEFPSRPWVDSSRPCPPNDTRARSQSMGCCRSRPIRATEWPTPKPCQRDVCGSLGLSLRLPSRTSPVCLKEALS